MYAALVHMGRTAKVDIPEDFRAELRQFMIVIRMDMLYGIHSTVA